MEKFLFRNIIIHFVQIWLLGLCAQLINDSYEKETLILGMVEMTNTTIGDVTYEGQCAENVGAAIEKIINQFKFDKSKIKGTFPLKNSNFKFILKAFF